MRKLVVNYTDGTKKEIVIEQVNIHPNNNDDKMLTMCHINPTKNGVMLNASSDIIPDIKFVNSFVFEE